MLIIAHRGASGEYPENTLLAFEQAIAQGCDGIELDVQYHHQNELVLLHDRYLDSKTNATGKINDYPLDELLQASIAKCKQQEPITTLSKALNTINARCLVNIEVKSEACDRQALESIIDLIANNIEIAVKHHNFSYPQFILSSFNHLLLQKAQQHLPQIKTAALIASAPLSISSLTQQLNVSAVNPSIDCLHQDLVNQVKQQNKAVWVYTVDRKQDIELCLQLGVDAIFTNHPAQTRKHIEQISLKNPPIDTKQ